MEQATDGQLMSLTREGDTEAFAVLIDRYKDALVNYLRHLTGSREQAEEYAQEAFVRLFSRAWRYDDRGKLAPYLFRIAMNLIRSDYRRAKRWEVLSLEFLRRDARPAPSPQRMLLEKEIVREVAEALSALPLHYRAPLVLREIEGWSYQEIAEALGCREGTIKSRLCRGRELLRGLLAEFWNGGGCNERQRASRAVDQAPA
ncbi:MAG TPA: RNA polymerase sigma factor [Thermoanaerobaculia bacterium]|nr:RNA polymerase sigma factor [Thermoanaerobaculia bacterium]